MDSIKKAKILEKFIDKLKNYDWSTNDGSNYHYDSDKLSFQLSNYSLHINYKDKEQFNNLNGFTFSLNEYKELNLLYLKMCEESLDNALNVIMEAEPDIKRELGLEDLIG